MPLLEWVLLPFDWTFVPVPDLSGLFWPPMKKFLILNLFISYCTGQMTSMWIPTRQLACGCPTIKPGESYLVLDELENGGKSSSSNSRYVCYANKYISWKSYTHTCTLWTVNIILGNIYNFLAKYIVFCDTYIHQNNNNCPKGH